MSKSENSLDLAGIGAAMQAIPDSAWEKLITTACKAFSDVVAPITETTAGVGRLVQAKFDRLIDAEKVLAASTLERAKEKALKVRKKRKAPDARILVHLIEDAASEVDSGIRELWANLIAQDMTGHSVHPEIPRILSRLCSEDAQLLADISEKTPKGFEEIFRLSIRIAFAAAPFGPFVKAPSSFTHAHLENLQLICRVETEWKLTTLGRGLIKAVSDPSLVKQGK